MPFRLPQAITAILGSETRARILALLADSNEPKTAYAISRQIEMKPPRVYRELRKLESAGLVGLKPDSKGRRRYYLAEEDLRRFLLRRARLASSEDWFSLARMRAIEEATERLKRIQVKLPPGRPNQAAVPNRGEFLRPPEKDRALRRASAPGSKRTRRGR